MKTLRSVFALALAVPLVHGLYAQSTDAYPGKHAVFVMTNSVTNNEVITYSRNDDGSLVESGQYATGGRGSGGTTDPLGSQGSLTLSQDGSLLFAVNAGSGNISVFHTDGAKLTLSQKISSGGSAPVAIAQYDNLVYVANFAGNSNIAGFQLDEAGTLIQIPNSIRYLSAANSGPSTLAFSPDGRFLLVTEKITNVVDVFTVKSDGSLSQATVNKYPLPGLFDVVFSPSGVALMVQTGPAGGVNTSSISSYMVEEGGTLSPITASVPALGSASCWVALTPNGQFAFTSNSASSTISAFAVGGSGDVTAVPGTIVASLPAGSTNLDIAVSRDDKYVYTVNSGTGTVSIFAVQSNGTLKLTGSVGGLVANSGLNGMAAM